MVVIRVHKCSFGNRFIQIKDVAVIRTIVYIFHRNIRNIKLILISDDGLSDNRRIGSGYSGRPVRRPRIPSSATWGTEPRDEEGDFRVRLVAAVLMTTGMTKLIKGGITFILVRLHWPGCELEALGLGGGNPGTKLQVMVLGGGTEKELLGMAGAAT